MAFISEETIQRVATGNLALSDPCVICGVKFSDCEHTVQDTEAVIKRARAVLKRRREDKR